ncbi:cyclase family protein [Rhodocaloribacter litoris]|uniref:cyclase family protein n=1 Tax=Rhodocaloribacter litoris TaxID=2558931 RepID=UPI00141E073C|nr:cyclase family protein [Rhodocaloribacter litoris]QXD15705.1 cyclase family protein [Rhodocaloribacter litoris]
MIATVHIGGAAYRVDLGAGLDVSIPLAFGGPQPSAFGIPPATAEPFEAGGFVGDVQRGGSCNVSTLRLTPHGNGTHTESVAHLVSDGPPVHTVAPKGLVPATLVSLTPEPAFACPDAYDPAPAANDRLLTRRALEAALAGAGEAFLEALVVRTRPNPPDKRHRDYLDQPPPFFSLDAMRYLVARGVRHLLLDLPSVDRLFDEGKLNAHRLFWGVPPGQRTSTPETAMHRTITEMVYVDDTVPDGRYLLALHVPPFTSDAAPSRPVLYPLQPVEPR